MGHKERAHSLLSPSGAHRWLECTPSAKLEAAFPDVSSEAAEEGTLAHELAEMKLRNYFAPSNFSRQKLNRGITRLKKDPLWDNEMMRHTDTYVDYIKAKSMEFDHQPYIEIEKKVDLSRYIPDGSGTADCIMVSGDTLLVVDLKYGKGVPVSAEGNPQLALYALGEYDVSKLLYPIKKIRMSIVQPRLDSISEWECSADELEAFGRYAKERAALAVKGEGEFRPGSKTCRFCKARAQCRARAEKNVQLAFFSDKRPPLISDEEVGSYLNQGEDVAKWLKDLQDYALKQCLAGKEIPGWKAVEGRGSREWTDMEQAFLTLQDSGIAKELLWESRPLTLAQVEKEVGKKFFESCVGGFVVKKPGKPTLVKDSDKRPAVTNQVTAEEVFKDQEEN